MNKKWEEEFDDKFIGFINKNNRTIRSDTDLVKHIEIKEWIAKQRTQLLAYCKKEIDELKLKHAEEMQFMQTN